MVLKKSLLKESSGPDSILLCKGGICECLSAMQASPAGQWMGPRQVAQAALFYEFSIEDHVPADHLLRKVDHFLDLSEVRSFLAPYYSSQGRPSIDPELMIRMLLVGYIMGIRSERRICEEVHLNLAYRWFCRLDLGDPVPDHSTFSKNRHGRFRDSDLFRHLFELVLTRCIAEGLVGGEALGVDASIVQADAKRLNKVEASDWTPERITRATEEYFETLDDAAFGAATPVKPKVLSPVDPAARFTGAKKAYSIFAYSTNYLVDLDNAVIVDVETTAPIRRRKSMPLWIWLIVLRRSLVYTQNASSEMALMATRKHWVGSFMKRVSSHMFLSSTDRSGSIRHSRRPISNSIMRMTDTFALMAKTCCLAVVNSRRSGPRCRTMKISDIALPKRTVKTAR